MPPCARHAFFDKLMAVNWLETEIKTKAAIKSGIGLLWQQLTVTVCDVVESYNKHYGSQHGEITVVQDDRSLWLKRRVFDPLIDGLSDAEIQVKVAQTGAAFLAAGDGYSCVVEIKVRPAHDGIYPVSGRGFEITLDEASRLLIRNFLFDPAYSKARPHWQK